MDFALSSKFKPRKFYDLLYIAITEVGDSCGGAR